MITFKPQQRENTPLILGIAGPSGSGKSLSALRVATGLAEGRPVFLINTEGARGHLYAEDFPVPTYDMEAPFSLERYKEAIDAAVAEKPGCLIIDSISHAHEGEGGMLDAHERELDRMAGNDWAKRERMTWAAWIKPKAAEAQLINTMLRADCHIILCMRAKDKIQIVKGEQPKSLGWQPICSDRMTFETTITLILPPGSEGKPDPGALGYKNRKPLKQIIGEVKQLDEETGRKLAAWAQGAPVDWDQRVAQALTTEQLSEVYSAMPELERQRLRAKIRDRKRLLETEPAAAASTGAPNLGTALDAIAKREFDKALDIARSLPGDERADVEHKVKVARG